MASYKYQSFMLTYRPKGGVTDPEITQICKLLQKNSVYRFIITEKLDEDKHVHAAVFYEKEQEMTHSAFNQKFKRKLYDNMSKGSNWKYAFVGKPMYNSSIIEDYLTKGDDTVVIEKNLPEKKTMSQYFKNTKKFDKKTAKAGDPYYHRLSEGYDDWAKTDTIMNTLNVEKYLCYRMYVARNLRLITEPRKMKATIRSLLSYLKKSETFDWHSNVERDDPVGF